MCIINYISSHLHATVIIAIGSGWWGSYRARKHRWWYCPIQWRRRWWWPIHWRWCWRKVAVAVIPWIVKPSIWWIIIPFQLWIIVWRRTVPIFSIIIASFPCLTIKPNPFDLCMFPIPFQHPQNCIWSYSPSNFHTPLIGIYGDIITSYGKNLIELCYRISQLV